MGQCLKLPELLGTCHQGGNTKEKQTLRLSCEEVSPGSLVPALVLFEGQLSLKHAENLYHVMLQKYVFGDGKQQAII